MLSSADQVCLVHKRDFPTLMLKPVPCQGAHGLGHALTLSVSQGSLLPCPRHALPILLVASVSHQATDSQHWAMALAHGYSIPLHRAVCPCAMHRHHEFESTACRVSHRAMTMCPWLLKLAQCTSLLSTLVPVRGGGSPHLAPYRCGHGVHATHVVEPMCACVPHKCLRHA